MFRSEVEATPSHPLSGSLSSVLWYDAERVVLGKAYTDEVTAYRARKRWTEALERSFLLEPQHDFRLHVKAEADGLHYNVQCDFLTACGRYAFWRLTHNQAPEVQYILETAHIPSLSIVTSPAEIDMSEMGAESAIWLATHSMPRRDFRWRMWARALRHWVCRWFS